MAMDQPRDVTPRERVVAAYKGQRADRVPAYPIAGSFAGCLDGLSIEEYCTNPKKAVKAMINYYERYQPDIMIADRKSTRLNSSHSQISYAVFCLKKTQLDINNTIDHRPEGDEKWFLENENTVTQFCRKLAAERPLKDIRDEYNYPKKKGIQDECSRLLEASTMKSRRGFAIQRLMNAMRQAYADGWFIVFFFFKLAGHPLESFYFPPNAFRD